MPTIFISYRRADSANITGRIYDRLTERYGRAHVFKDVDSIPAGVNFPEYIAESIQASDVALVVIGPRWLNVSAGFAQRRLDDPADFVRVEIETALRLGVPVIPVLVDSASLPSARRLPASLRPLLRQNGLAVRQDPDFSHDMERVFAAIDYWQAQPRRPAPEPSAPPSPSAHASAPVFSPASPAPGVAHRPAATAVAERIGIARSRPHRLPARVAPLLTLISALALIAVSVTLVFNGTAERILNPPNMPATQTASALASLHHQATAQRATQQALAHATPYIATGVGPCDRKDPPYSQASPYYWGVVSPGLETCASDGVTAEIQNGGGLYFYGLQGGFPASFEVTVTMRFRYADPSNCASFEADSETQAPTANGVRYCDDGSFTVSHAPGGHSNSQPIAAPDHVTLTMKVQQQQMSVTVNDHELFSGAPYTGPTEFLLIGATGSPLDVSNFSLTPGAL